MVREEAVGLGGLWGGAGADGAGWELSTGSGEQSRAEKGGMKQIPWGVMRGTQPLEIRQL